MLGFGIWGLRTFGNWQRHSVARYISVASCGTLSKQIDFSFGMRSETRPAKCVYGLR